MREFTTPLLLLSLLLLLFCSLLVFSTVHFLSSPLCLSLLFILLPALVTIDRLTGLNVPINPRECLRVREFNEVQFPARDHHKDVTMQCRGCSPL